MLTYVHPKTGAEPRSGSRRTGGAGLLALLIVAAFTAASWLVERPPAPVPATAPATQFSADRAWTHLERIATSGPTPVGSTTGDAVRDYLVAELTRLGLQPDVQRGTGSVVFGPNVTAGRAENVISTIPGTAPTGRLLLAAHYDSTFSGPGAADDKASVAAILEAARALTSGPRPRNDVMLLLTDAEEPGMVGAAAYVNGHPDGRLPAVVLNWEGPGNAGSSIVFQASPGAAGVVSAFAADAPYRIGSSLFPTITELMGSHTDLNVLGEAGYEGLSFGFNDGRAYYHSSQDTVENLDRASLQQHGENLLALARSFGDRDLPPLFSDVDVTYFTLFGLVVRYPSAAALALALIALAAVATLAVLARRQGTVTLPRLAAGAGAGLLLVVAAAAAAKGLWEVLLWLRPGYGSIPLAEPYQPGLYRWALWVVTAAVVLIWFLLLRGRVGDTGLAIGGLLWPTLLGVLLALTAPATAFVVTVPALLVSVAGLVAAAVGTRRPRLQLVVWTIGIAPAVALLAGAARSALLGAGLGMGYIAAAGFALAALLTLPLVAAALPVRSARTAALLPAVMIALSFGLVAAGLGIDRFDASHPQPTSLRYVLNADTGLARWESSDAEPHDWVRRFTPDRARAESSGPALPYRATAEWTGPAVAVPFAAPELTELDAGPGTVRLHLRSARDADVVTLATDRPVEHVKVVVNDGMPSEASPEAAEMGGRWPFQLQFYDPPAEGITVELRVADTAGMRVSVADYTPSLQGLPGFTPRPPELTRSNQHDGDITVVTRTYEL
jgi:Peptidase family M28